MVRQQDGASRASHVDLSSVLDLDAELLANSVAMRREARVDVDLDLYQHRLSACAELEKEIPGPAPAEEADGEAVQWAHAAAAVAGGVFIDRKQWLQMKENDMNLRTLKAQVAELRGRMSATKDKSGFLDEFQADAEPIRSYPPPRARRRSSTQSDPGVTSTNVNPIFRQHPLTSHLLIASGL